VISTDTVSSPRAIRAPSRLRDASAVFATGRGRVLRVRSRLVRIDVGVHELEEAGADLGGLGREVEQHGRFSFGAAEVTPRSAKRRASYSQAGPRIGASGAPRRVDHAAERLVQ